MALIGRSGWEITGSCSRGWRQMSTIFYQHSITHLCDTYKGNSNCGGGRMEIEGTFNHRGNLFSLKF